MSLVIAAISYLSRSDLHRRSISAVLPEPTGPPTPTRSGPFVLLLILSLRHGRACPGHLAWAGKALCVPDRDGRDKNNHDLNSRVYCVSCRSEARSARNADAP